MEDMRKIRVKIELEHKELVIEVDENLTAGHICELAWCAAMNAIDVNWRDEKTRKDNVKLKIKPRAAFCDLSVFSINGIEADYRDFGDKRDIAPEEADLFAIRPCICGNMQFIPQECRNEILKKYDITEGEYYLICQRLKEALSFGKCGWCKGDNR